MKLTNETFRELYLKDLALPDTFHGRSTPKVKYLKQWKNIPISADDNQLNVIDMNNINYDIWALSDTHFGHSRIIKYCDRPFAHADAMNNKLIENYVAMIKPNDVVIWGGDIAFMQDAEINSILDQLPGYKIHIIGNHDFDRSRNLKNLSMNERHLCYVMDIIDGDSNFQLLFTHYPITRIPENCVNIHGHIHNNIADPWNINISVEHTEYAPMNLKMIVERARNYLENS